MAPQVTVFGSRPPSPNPPKVVILLEELGVDYQFIIKDLSSKGTDSVKHPDFLKINPNGRVPAIIDHTNNDKVVWESGAILLYLAERFDKSHKLVGTNADERADILTWLFFQVSGQGPPQGQANWFINVHPVKDLHPSVVERYQNEARRVYSVLEKHLEKERDWIALNHLTVADIAWYPWTNIVWFAKLDLTPWPKVQAWHDRMKALPSVQRAYDRIKEEADTYKP